MRYEVCCSCAPAPQLVRSPLCAGSSVVIEMDVEVRVPQDDFVFGVGIYHADGSCVYGTNTDLEGLMDQAAYDAFVKSLG